MNTNNEILPFVNAFIPSAQKWILHWLWTNAYPELLESDALKLTKMILVDQNKNNWIAVISNVWPNNTIYGDALARLCKRYHIDRNILNTLVSHLHTVADTEF